MVSTPATGSSTCVPTSSAYKLWHSNTNHSPPIARHRYPSGLLRFCLQSDPDDVFIRSLQQYLRANQFSTGTSHKLWEAVAQETGLPITRWMEQWTYQGGFPLVSATLSGGQVQVSQVSAIGLIIFKPHEV